MRRLAATLLALSAAGCAEAEPPYRVALPDGWEDGHRYRAQFEQGINAGNPGWAQYRLRQVARGSIEGTWIILATFCDPPRSSLRGLARRMIQYSAGSIPGFQLRRRPRPATVDDAPAVIYDFATTGRRIRNALIRYDDDIYLVSLTSTSTGFRRDTSGLADVLDSWRWT